MHTSQRDAFLAQLRNHHKSGSVPPASGISLQTISSGTTELDWAVGAGGLPLGRIVELFGAEGTWKSTIAMRAMASVQRLGETCFYLDSERKFDPDYARSLGVDTSRMTLYSHSTAEYAFEEVEHQLLVQAPRLIVIDSLSGLIPKALWEDLQATGGTESFDQTVEPHIHRIAALAAETQTAVLVISQLRDRWKAVFGPAYESYAGRALRHHASVRIELKRKSPIKTDGFVVGEIILARVVKNQIGSPWREAEMRFEYQEMSGRISANEQVRSSSGLVLENADIDWLSAVGTRREIDQGEVLIEEGHHIESVYFVINGEFSVRTAVAGDREVARLLSGEVMGEMSFLDHVPTSATVTALLPSRVLVVPRRQLDSRLATDPDFAARLHRALSTILAARLRQTVTTLAGPSQESPHKPASDSHLAKRLAIAAGQ